MTVIAVLNQKGGAGKTTIATHLATALHLAGHRVTLIDTDPQGSSLDWGAIREDHPLPVISLPKPTIERDIKALAPADFYIIDGAPQVSDLVVSAIKAADFVLIPVQPSPYDIWASADTVELVKTRIEIMDGRLQAAFVVSRAIVNTDLGRDVIGELEKFGLPILATRIHQRVIYPGSAITGQTVMEIDPEHKGAVEMTALMDEILVRLDGART
jgi:chromosome partitioning protein